MAALKSLFCALAAFLSVALCAEVSAQQQNLRLVEQDIKAGLLYNFLRYTQWPDGARVGAPLIVCVYGGDPLSGRLAPMTGRTVNQRPIELRFVDAEAEINGCAMLYVNAEARTVWPRLRSYLATRHVLTVSDYDGFARAGGMIEFTRANNRIGVRVNVDAAQNADLIVQDRLLRLASVVRSDGT